MSAEHLRDAIRKAVDRWPSRQAFLDDLADHGYQVDADELDALLDGEWPLMSASSLLAIIDLAGLRLVPRGGAK